MSVYQAAQKGEMEAQYTLGNFYNNGQIVKKDYNKALEWWSKAAKQGHAYSLNNIGLLYATGNIEQNFIKAYAYLLIADKLGCEASADNLEIVKKEIKLTQIPDAIELFNKLLEEFTL